MSNDIAVVGGGIIGLATAFKLQLKYPGAKVVVYEKDNELGSHQSGRNSGVLHCGLYYMPGSLKAKLAVSGIQQMTDFCRKNEVEHDICGKIVVASDNREVSFLDSLADRGQQNGLKGLKFLSSNELKQREPFVISQKTLLVPEEGIVNYKAVMHKLASLIQSQDGVIKTSSEVIAIKSVHGKEVIYTQDGERSFDLVINCTGLFSDRTYKKFTGTKRPLRIIPFRGEYLMLKDDAKKLVNHLIYPVPDPKYPFLGVHFTRLINGEREVGPNAVFAFKREGYTNRDFSFYDSFDSITYKGFIRFISKNFAFSVGELSSSLFISKFLDKARKLIPDINETMFVKGTAGVRAQAMDGNGALLMDFNVIRVRNQIHVLNAPSPGATASLAIADYILNEYL